MKSYLKGILAQSMILVSSLNANNQFEAIKYTKGSWVMQATFFEEGKWATPKSPVSAVADTTLNDAFIRMRVPVEFPDTVFQFEMTLSFDRFNNTYRLAFLDDVNGFMDIYSGTMRDGILTVTNAETGSTFPDGNGGKVIGKLEIQAVDKGFQIRAYTSSKPQGPYTPYMKLDFKSADSSKHKKAQQ